MRASSHVQLCEANAKVVEKILAGRRGGAGDGGQGAGMSGGPCSWLGDSETAARVPIGLREMTLSKKERKS